MYIRIKILKCNYGVKALFIYHNNFCCFFVIAFNSKAVISKIFLRTHQTVLNSFKNPLFTFFHLFLPHFFNIMYTFSKHCQINNSIRQFKRLTFRSIPCDKKILTKMLTVHPTTTHERKIIKYGTGLWFAYLFVENWLFIHSF